MADQNLKVERITDAAAATKFVNTINPGFGDVDGVIIVILKNQGPVGAVAPIKDGKVCVFAVLPVMTIMQAISKSVDPEV